MTLRDVVILTRTQYDYVQALEKAALRWAAEIYAHEQIDWRPGAKSGQIMLLEALATRQGNLPDINNPEEPFLHD
jgi:hypothetical protein